MAESDDEPIRKGVYFFGRDLSQIPCFRDSFLYGIGTGLGVGLLYFMFTSKVSPATNYGYGAFCLTTICFWCTCRYDRSKKNFEMLKLQEYLKKKVIIEGTVDDYDLAQVEEKMGAKRSNS